LASTAIFLRKINGGTCEIFRRKIVRREVRMTRFLSGLARFRRGPWEMLATILIGLGVVMLMQPFFLWAFTWSFVVTLIGTVMFIITSHFPE
jgi:low affinity Fe/Cu permease